MKIESSESCKSCEGRPACELAGQKYEKLERAASLLGFTVIEGSVVCRGRIAGSLMLDLDSRCGARLTAPELASTEERERIAELSRLDEQAANVLPDTQEIVQSLK